mgnify:CR=1 FL=1
MFFLRITRLLEYRRRRGLHNNPTPKTCQKIHASWPETGSPERLTEKTELGLASSALLYRMGGPTEAERRQQKAIDRAVRAQVERANSRLEADRRAAEAAARPALAADLPAPGS